MGIRVICPNGHKLNVKSFLAGKRGVCPHCGSKFEIPADAGSDPPPDGPALPAGAAPVVPAQSAPVSQPTQPAASPANLTTPQPTTPQSTTPPSTAPVQAAAVPAQPQAAPVRAVVTRPAVPDPLAEAPDASWYVRPPSGGQYGPAKADIMRQWIEEGRVTADSLVWREGWGDWQMASATFSSMGATGGPTAPAGAAAAQSTAVAAPVQAAGASEAFPSIGSGGGGAGGRATNYRRKDNTGRVLAIGFLFLSLIVLTVLLVYVLYYQPGG